MDPVLATVAVIDDDSRELQQIVDMLNLFAEDSGLQIIFTPYSPQTNEQLENILSNIANGTTTTSIIIDQKLGDTSSISFTGTEITDRLRIARPFLPIYLLTKYIKDSEVTSNASLLEETLDKSTISDNLHIYLPRIARASMRYAMHMREQAERLREIIEISYLRELSDSEKEELGILRSQAFLSRIGEIIINQPEKIDFSPIEETNRLLNNIIGKLNNEDHEK